MDLYRIVSLESFVDLVMNKKERYTRPVSWDDCYESFMYETLTNEEGRKQLIKTLYSEINPNNPKVTINNFVRLWYARFFVYAQCWSEEKDSDALWRIYSYNKHAIQLVTSKTRIQKIMKQSSQKFHIDSVKYDVNEHTDIFKEQVQGVKKTLSIYEPYFHKRQAFQHEKEHRVLVYDESKFIVSSTSAWGAKAGLSRKGKTNEEIIDNIVQSIENSIYGFSKENVNDNFYVLINDFKDYIIEVRVHPLAEQWYVDLVKNICDLYEIKFGGQSQLYKKN